MAHQLGISLKYLKQTIHLNPVHQCNIKRNLIDHYSCENNNSSVCKQIHLSVEKSYICP